MPLFSRLPGSLLLLKWVIRRMVRATFRAEDWEVQIVADSHDRLEFTV